jgi:hypothetical protein
MTSYPEGHFVQEFSRRTLDNIQAARYGRAIEWRDTALVSFLLAVFVLPHERIDEDKFMASLLEAYPHDLAEVVKIIRRREHKDDEGNEDLLPRSIGELPRYLRHAISHFNIRPESADGQELTHLLVWNQVPDNKRRYGNNAGKIDFVARIHIKRLRKLAIYVLKRLSESKVGDRYEAIDPIVAFDGRDELTRSKMVT